jgi:hypothetical protein
MSCMALGRVCAREYQQPPIRLPGLDEPSVVGMVEEHNVEVLGDEALPAPADDDVFAVEAELAPWAEV